MSEEKIMDYDLDDPISAKVIAIVAFFVALFAVAGVLLIMEQNKKTAKVLWQTPQAKQKMFVNGQLTGCIVNGVDEKGFYRWMNVPCDPEPAQAQPMQAPLTKKH